jgi:hypothetical protein
VLNGIYLFCFFDCGRVYGHPVNKKPAPITMTGPDPECPGSAKIRRSEFENCDDHHHLFGMSDILDAVFDPADFSFVVKMRGKPERPWIWEVHCAGRAKPVERSPVFYKSAGEAAKEGKKALARILKAESGSLGSTSNAA